MVSKELFHTDCLLLQECLEGRPQVFRHNVEIRETKAISTDCNCSPAKESCPCCIFQEPAKLCKFTSLGCWLIRRDRLLLLLLLLRLHLDLATTHS